MRWLLIVILVLGAFLWLYVWANQPAPTPPTTFQKPSEIQPELKEKGWLEAKLINPPSTVKESYQFKIEGQNSSFQTEPFIIKDIRIYKETGERIIENRFLLPENFKNPQKIILIALPGENIAEANIAPELRATLKDKTGKTLFEISIINEKSL